MPRQRHQRKTTKSVFDILDKTSAKITALIISRAVYLLEFIVAICVALAITGYLAFRDAQKTGFPHVYRSRTTDSPAIVLSGTINRISVDDAGNESLDLIINLENYSPGIKEAEGKQYCIENIYLTTVPSSRTEALNNGFIVMGSDSYGIPTKIFELENECTLNDPSYGDIATNLLTSVNGELTPSSSVKEWAHPIRISNTLYSIDLTRYPYDIREDTILLWVNLQTSDGEVISVAPEISLWIEPIGRESNVLINKQSEELPYGVNAATSIQIQLKRPISIRFLTAVLLLSLAGFILAIPFVRDNGVAIEISLGILLGLWGIRDILVPSDIKGITFIQSAIIYLYFLLALISIMRFFAIPLYRKFRHPDQVANQSNSK